MGKAAGEDMALLNLDNMLFNVPRPAKISQGSSCPTWQVWIADEMRNITASASRTHGGARLKRQRSDRVLAPSWASMVSQHLSHIMGIAKY